MIDERTTFNITGGMNVFGSDGQKVGSIEGVQGDYVVVSKGFFFPTDYFVPTSAINNVDNDGVYLNVTRDDALNQGWDTAPENRETTTATNGQVPDYGVDHVTAAERTGQDDPLLLNQDTGYVTGGDSAPQDPAKSTGKARNDSFLLNEETGYVSGRDSSPKTSKNAVPSTDSDTVHVALSEEELTARTRDVERGHVTIDKVVTEREASLDVPVTEEHVNVARRTVDRDLEPGETSFEQGTIDIPVKGQDVEVSKRAHVVEELDITKAQVQDTQHVTDKVRREEAHIRDDAGNLLEDVTDKVKNTARGKGKRS